MSLFDKETGTSTSYNNSSITDTSKSWRVNQFENWFIEVRETIGINIVIKNYQITSNTADTLSFSNDIASDVPYTISFVDKDYLNQIESDLSNTTKIPDDLISKKYNQASIDIDNKTFAYIRKTYTTDFDPTKNIMNLFILQRAFAYYMLYLIYTDLMISADLFNNYKREDYYSQYNSTIKDGLALLQMDFNQDGEIDSDEIKESVGGVVLQR